MDSWLIALNTVRNVCAHHGRLWNRIIGTPPAIPSIEKDSRWHTPHAISGERIFGTLTVLSYLLSYVAPNTKWRERLIGLLAEIESADLRGMGFEEGWQSCPFWEPWAREAASTTPAQST